MSALPAVRHRGEPRAGRTKSLRRSYFFLVVDFFAAGFLAELLLLVDDFFAVEAFFVAMALLPPF